MTSERVQSGETDRIWIFARDGAGVGVTGATITFKIRKDIENVWWNGTAFQVAHTTVSGVEADATNLPGLYYYDFNTLASIEGGMLAYASTTTAAVANSPWMMQIKVGGFVNYIDSPLSDIGIGVDVLNPSPTLLSLIRSQIIIMGQSIDKISEDVARLVKATYGTNV